MDALRVLCAAPDWNHAHIAVLVDGFNIAVNQVDMDVGLAHKFDNPGILDFFLLVERVREGLHLLSVHRTLILGRRLTRLRLVVVDFLRADGVPLLSKCLRMFLAALRACLRTVRLTSFLAARPADLNILPSSPIGISYCQMAGPSSRFGNTGQPSSS